MADPGWRLATGREGAGGGVAEGLEECVAAAPGRRACRGQKGSGGHCRGYKFPFAPFIPQRCPAGAGGISFSPETPMAVGTLGTRALGLAVAFSLAGAAMTAAAAPALAATCPAVSGVMESAR